MKRLLCWLGRHDWIRMNGFRLTGGDRAIDRACTRCGLTEFWE